MYQKEGENKWIPLSNEHVKVVDKGNREYIVEGAIYGSDPGKYKAKLRLSNDNEHTENDTDKLWGPYSEPIHFDKGIIVF